MSALPATISKATARLPQTYEAAKAALSNCSSIDECKEWANQAEALASYARQADDKTMLNIVMRIKARAVRRVGELLQQYDGRGRPPENTNGTVGISQTQAASDAGLSQRQKETAVRVANVPSDHFEQSIESHSPPTVTKLAEIGKQTRAIAPPPEGFAQATYLLGSVGRFAEFCGKYTPEFVAGGLKPFEYREAREQVAIIDAWLDRFIVRLTE